VLLATAQWPGSAALSPPPLEVAIALGYDIEAALEEPDATVLRRSLGA
jgi:hypothetical protein